MRKTLLKTAILTVSISTSAAFAQNKDIPEHINQFSYSHIDTIADNTLQIEVKVKDGSANKPYSWKMTPADIAVFYKKLKSLPTAEAKISNLKITNPHSEYSGLEFTITNKYGENIEPFTVFDGKLKTLDGREIAKDYNRDFEYTVWGLNYSSKNQELMVKMLPITNFDDCIKLGNKLVETTPRQCLLRNGDIFLDINEKPTQEALSIKNFDDCLVKGQAIINTFPRRCIAAGGHVYAEPPRIR